MQMVTDTPRDYDAWHDTVQKMIDRGARGTPEEFDLVMDYLFQNVTPIDVNHADPEMLDGGAACPPVGGRRHRGAPDSRGRSRIWPIWRALMPGLDKALLDAKKRMIFFQ